MTTGASRFRPGPHHGLIWPSGLAVLDGSVPGEQAVELWEAVADCADLSTFFTHLAAVTGRGLLDLPSFGVAVLSASGAAHLAARGRFRVEFTREGSSDEIGGESITTWVERRLDDLDTLVVAALEERHATVTGEDSMGWPVISGVVPSSRVDLGDPAHGAAPPFADGTPVAEAPPTRRPAVEKPAADKPPDEVQPAEAQPTREPIEVPAAVEPQPPIVSAPADPLPANGVASGMFAYLLNDHTVITPPEDAAVRPSEEAPETTPAVDGGPAGGDAVEVDMPVPDLASPTPEPRAADETWAEPPRPGDGGASQDPRFVSWVPSATPSTPSARRAAPATPAGHLPAGHAVDAATLGDHDGETIMSLPEPDASPGPFSGPAPGAGADLVLGVLCPDGHANPPQRAQCRLCHARLEAPPHRMARPALGRLTASTGEAFEITGPVVVGRNPRAARFQGTEIPRLLAIPQAHVSASHLEIRIEGWSVLAVDLKSTNGTFLRRHGDPPVRLPETAQLLVSDDVLDLGHGIHLGFAGLP